MIKQATDLQKAIQAKDMILIAELIPPTGSNSDAIRNIAKQYNGNVHALGINDNHNRVSMSALAAASIVKASGVEPILHMVTRDKNRIALISEFLGAQALQIGNILCTSGSHQTLGSYNEAKNVFDIDSVQLVQTLKNLKKDASIIGEEKIDEIGEFCLCVTADPYGDPAELQIMRMAGKINAGASIIITKPVFDIEKFESWLNQVKSKGLHKKAAIIAGIKLLKDAQSAKIFAEKRPNPMLPDALLKRITDCSDAKAQKEEGIKIAVEIIEKLGKMEGIRGFAINGSGDDAAALDIINKSGLRKK